MDDAAIRSTPSGRILTFGVGPSVKVKSDTMVDDKTAHLQSEIKRLAAMLNAEPVKVGVLLTNDDLNIFIDDGGKYHYSYWERGRPNFDRVGELDDVLYWYAQGIAHDIGSGYSATNSAPNRDFRISLWARQYEALNQLNPHWAKRWVRETADKLRGWGREEDVELLPNIPERDASPDPDLR
ncbi:MAG TPA: Imm63 family immunity protein [Mycobacterium sp.]|nr:Imm63 family immunity protein [Mycobacterium sp.]